MTDDADIPWPDAFSVRWNAQNQVPTRSKQLIPTLACSVITFDMLEHFERAHDVDATIRV